MISLTPVLRLERLAKRYGAVVAVDGVDAEIREGELVSFVGPSGCGKTTLLRMAGGFVRPDAGRVLLDGRDVTRDPPNRRRPRWSSRATPSSPPHGGGQRRLRAPRPGPAARRRRRPRRGSAPGRSARRARRPPPGRAVRGPAAARRAGPRAQRPAAPAPPRRASLEPRREPPRADARGDQAAPAGAAPDRRLCHPRPGGGDVDLRPHRRHAGGPDRAGGDAAEIYERPATEFVARFVGTANFLDGEVAGARGAGSPSGLRSASSWCARRPRGSRRGRASGSSLRPEAMRLRPASRRRRPGPAGQDRRAPTGAVVRYLVEVGGTRLAIDVHNPRHAPRHADGDRVSVQLPADPHVLPAAPPTIPRGNPPKGTRPTEKDPPLPQAGIAGSAGKRRPPPHRGTRPGWRRPPRARPR